MPPEDRIATFDQDGTLWVEHPMYTQVVFALDRVVALAPEHPEWKTNEPFKTVLSGDRAAMAKLTLRDLEEIVVATHAGMTVEAFAAIVKEWLAKAKNPRWDRPYTELVYQPMLEVLSLCAPTATGPTSSPAAARTSCAPTPSASTASGPAQVIGSTLETGYKYDAEGQGELIREPKLLLNDNNAGKPEGIYLFIGRRPHAAFGNSTGDRQMLEWTTAGDGSAARRCSCCTTMRSASTPTAPRGLPDTKVGTFTQALMDEAKQRGWIVISMKNDWNTIFAKKPK